MSWNGIFEVRLQDPLHPRCRAADWLFTACLCLALLRARDLVPRRYTEKIYSSDPLTTVSRRLNAGPLLRLPIRARRIDRNILTGHGS